ncbi:LCP family protein [Prescottella agglutinans]|uniref:LCP family protein required for cell wall assembly n=1 Tax=Prescottella agglutinans TaxID=1644129 RepID=A0ABT6M3N0_9NOCA|nr:LCP family protein [Prescottella agglutinans]MDH6278927.1 LCP family protein required for cell wall assembly [Prescottella agglutinans]
MFARATGAVASVLVLTSTGLAWGAQRDLITGLTRSDALDAVSDENGTSSHGDSNILLIGLDSRKDMDGNDLPAAFVTDQLHAGDSDVGGYNTNTLILLHVPGDGSRATAAAIPRDDYVEVPGYGKHKIKEAYGLAKADADAELEAQGVSNPAEREQKARDAGRRSTLKTVQNLLRVPIDHFAEVNLVGFYDIAKVLGPLEVCLNAPVDDSEYSGARFPAGRQFLDPSQALSFVRQRHGLDNGDLDRTHRQQAFLSAVIRNLKSTGVFGNLTKMKGLADAVKNDIVIDSRFDPVDFALHSRNLTDGSVDFYTLPIEGYDTVNGQDVNVVDPNRLRGEVARLFSGSQASASAAPTTTSAAPTPDPRVTVDVLNGTSHDGLAAAVATALQLRGYTPGSTATAKSTATTTITYGTGAEAVAQSLADELGAETESDASVAADHVRIVIGRDLADDLMSILDTPAPSAAAAVIPTSGAQGAPIAADTSGGIPCVD